MHLLLEMENYPTYPCESKYTPLSQLNVAYIWARTGTEKMSRLFPSQSTNISTLVIEAGGAQKETKNTFGLRPGIIRYIDYQVHMYLKKNNSTDQVTKHRKQKTFLSSPS